MNLLLFSGVLLVANAPLPGKAMENIYMKRSEIEDQASSASAYSYQVQSGAPLSYVQAPQGLNHFGYPPITRGRYTQELPLQLPLTQEYRPQPLPLVPLNSYGQPANPAAYTLYPLPLELAKYSPAVEEQLSTKFAKGGGASYGAANQAAHGEKGASGYQNYDAYDKGAKGKHENEAHKGHYSQEGANKAGHQEQAAHYNKHDAAAKGEQGASFHQKNGHKKGSKTTGYHRVHHKDEYKKDHSFYDEADKSGHFNKYGDYDAKQGAEKGRFEKGARQEAAYEAADRAAKGASDKGRYVEQDQGYKGAEGKQAHYKDFQDYAAKKGQQQQNQEGYAEEAGESQ